MTDGSSETPGGGSTSSEQESAECRLCGESSLAPLMRLGEHPIAHRLLEDPGADEYVHHLTLQFCESCGLTQLTDPIPPEELYTNYNWLTSWKPHPHMPRLLDLVSEYADAESDPLVFEIGSNDGTFLAALAERGFKRTLGIEPAQDATRAAEERGVKTIHGFFAPETAQQIRDDFGQVQVLAVRHVLEHIQDLTGVARAMRTVLAPGAVVLAEVPNFAMVNTHADYSALWEEHVNYFTVETLKAFLAEAGVTVDHWETAVFSGESLIVIGRQSDSETGSATEYVPRLRSDAMAYADQWPRFRQSLLDTLESHRDSGGKVGLYGAGCRAATIVNLAGLAPCIEVVFDDQPEKQNRYMPGSRLPIVSGDKLMSTDVDLCLLAVNAESESKVIDRHSDYRERGGVFASILPPSDRLLPVSKWA